MIEPSARDRELARKIAQEVAEMPGRTSPDDEPDMMFVTQDEIEKIAGCYLAAARAEGMAQGRREAIKDARLSSPAFSQLPPSWSIVARLPDLLRDAARYRWLREPGRLCEVFFGNAGDTLNVNGAPPEYIDALIDAEIARNAEGGDRG